MAKNPDKTPLSSPLLSQSSKPKSKKSTRGKVNPRSRMSASGDVENVIVEPSAAEDVPIGNDAPTQPTTKGSNSTAQQPQNNPVGNTITERGWDGWPTKPTPHYLIPRMGEVPVSSTIHFQTVAITSMHDNRLTSAMWSRIKMPLITALRRKSADAAGSLLITKAVYGDFPQNFHEFPKSATADVTKKVKSALTGAKLSIPASNSQFGDHAVGIVKSLRVYLFVGRERIIKEVQEGKTFKFSAALKITRAIYGDLPKGAKKDVTDIVVSKIKNNSLHIKAENGLFTDTAPNTLKSLEIKYSIDGKKKTIQVREHEEVNIGGALDVERAFYGDLPPLGTIDVTEQVAKIVRDGKLSVDAQNTTFKFDPAYNIVKKLRVEYSLGGVKSSKIVNENETLTLVSDPDVVDPTAVFKQFFDPHPETVERLADRLSAAGLTATDFNPEARFVTMEEQLNSLLGVSEDERLDPVAYADHDATSEPAEGVILYHEQGWYGRGLALGNLLHSVALAPGEVTQVAMTHWNHSTRASDQESLSQEDSTSASDLQNRSVSEIQDAAVREHAWGSSAAESSAQSTAFGTSSINAKASLGFFGSIKGSISGNSSSFGSSHNVSTAVTQSAGDKNVAMNANQRVNAATKRHSEASRTRRASVVREVSQSEGENITTRVVANYNHMHSLTMMYFEVIEVFSLKTRVVDAERVIFMPFVVRDVVDLIPKYAAVLIDAANAARRPDLAQAIRHYRDDPSELDTLDEALNKTDGHLKQASARITQLNDTIIALPNKNAAKRAARRSEIEGLNKKRSDIISGMSSFKDLSDIFGALASHALRGQLHPIEEQIAYTNGQLEVLQIADEHELRQLEIELRESTQIRNQLKHNAETLHQSQALAIGLESRSKKGPFYENRLFFNHAVWLSLSPSEVLSLAMRRNRFNGEKISEQIDPAPVAITGNYVAYRWRFFESADSQRFKKQYVQPFIGDPEQELATVSADVAVPTGGVFGEAVLGEAVSAEKIDLSRFWNWKDSMIPILPTSINPITAATPSMQNLDPTPGKLDETSAKLDPLQDLPAPSGFGALAQTMQAQIFRDMSGQDMLKSLAEATTKAAASSEQNAAAIASKNLQAGLNFMSDMADKAIAVAAAPETGGASLLGGMVKSDNSGGASLLGGVLNAKDAGGNGDVFAKMAGGKEGLAKTVTDMIDGAGKEKERTGKTGQKSASDGGTEKLPPGMLEPK